MKNRLPLILACSAAVLAGCTTATQQATRSLDTYGDAADPTRITATSTTETKTTVRSVFGGKQAIESARATQSPTGSQSVGSKGIEQDAASEQMTLLMQALVNATQAAAKAAAPVK